MKNLIFSFFLTTILSTSIIGQNKKTCDTPEDNFEELNTISIKKCNVADKENKTATRKITTNISARKKNNRIAHYIRKDSKTSNAKRGRIKLTSKAVLFSTAENIPLFKNCNDSKNKSCFNKEFYAHFSKNFRPENVSEDGIEGRAYIQFTIGTNGKASNILVRGPKNSKNLYTEIKRILSKLPSLKPATHKGIPVSVKYSLPINLTLF